MVKVPENLGPILRDYLSQSGMTQEGFARKCGLGKRTIQRLFSKTSTKAKEETIRAVLVAIGPDWASDALAEEHNLQEVVCMFDKLSSANKKIALGWICTLLEKQRAVERAQTNLDTYRSLQKEV
jgi:transcriptional regulator with XRE-family HTH domain